MKKEFETPTIEIIYFDLNVNLGDSIPEFKDDNVDEGGWV